jgi:anthranilate synthase component 2
VVKNDGATVAEIKKLAPGHIIISPGPGRPAAAGICEEAVLSLMADTPILGVCLGHQAISEALGASVGYARELMHGKQSHIHVASGSPLFKGLPPLIYAGRYHSLAVRRDSLPDDLLVIAEDADGEVMGVKHKKYDLYGLQFHPESILTPEGGRIIENFLKIGGGRP